MLARVLETISRYSMFASGQRVGVAVSGGADSVCLLHALAELAPRWELWLAILHLDHQMRGEESQRDSEFVQDLAARAGLECVVETAEVPLIARKTGDNLEQAARRCRREFFLRAMADHRLDRVALGHTRADQAETVLFRFLRGSGTAGLAGMRPVTPEGFVRPLLEVGRDEVRNYLVERGIEWREDSSNNDRNFARNRIRHDLIPLLEREWNPALAHILAQTAEVARDEEDYWAALVEDAAAGGLIVRPPAVYFRAAWLTGLPRALARRMVRKAVEIARADLLSIDCPHVEQVLRLASSREGSGRLQLPRLDVFRSFDWVRLAPPGLDSLENRGYAAELSVPGRYDIPGTGWAIETSVSPADPSTRIGVHETGISGYNKGESELDWGRIAGPLKVRNWAPGDRYQPAGHTDTCKIKFLFQEARVPLWLRRKWPVIASGEAILWAAQFGPAAEYAATLHSETILKVRELGDFREIS